MTEIPEIKSRQTRRGGFVTWGKILRYIYEFTEAEGFSPTFIEIREAMNVASTSTIAHHVDYLLARGLLTHRPGRPRTMRVTEQGRRLLT